VNHLLHLMRSALRQVCWHPMWTAEGKPGAAAVDVLVLVECDACGCRGYIPQTDTADRPRPRWSRTTHR
jgi:hypothetical protein